MGVFYKDRPAPGHNYLQVSIREVENEIFEVRHLEGRVVSVCPWRKETTVENMVPCLSKTSAFETANEIIHDAPTRGWKPYHPLLYPLP